MTLYVPGGVPPVTGGGVVAEPPPQLQNSRHIAETTRNADETRDAPWENRSTGAIRQIPTVTPKIPVTNMRVLGPDPGADASPFVANTFAAAVESVTWNVAVAVSKRKSHGGKEHCMELGAPEQVRETTPKKPFSDESWIWKSAASPGATEAVVSSAFRAKSGRLIGGGDCSKTDR
jgi:hypothetical protein